MLEGAPGGFGGTGGLPGGLVRLRLCGGAHKVWDSVQPLHLFGTRGGGALPAGINARGTRHGDSAGVQFATHIRR